MIDTDELPPRTPPLARRKRVLVARDGWVYLGTRIPPDVAGAVDKYSQTYGVKKQKIVDEALRLFFKTKMSSRSDSWLAKLGAQDAIKEEVLETLAKREIK